MNFVFENLKKLSTPKRIVMLMIVFIVAYLLINGKPFGVAELKERTNGVGVLDLEPGYTPDQGYEILMKLGPEGRAFYRQIMLFDLIFPVTYMLFFASLILFLFSKWLPGKPALYKLSLLPIAAGIADYVENIFILIMLNSYPAKLNAIIVAANIFTLTKLILISLSILLVDSALLGIVYKALRDKYRGERRATKAMP